VLAANAAFAGFPRLSAIQARDGFLPRPRANVGDKLVFNNGILMLAVFSSILIIVFKGNVHYLIPLYAVGVFLSFTLSQAGMVRHWLRERDILRGLLKPEDLENVHPIHQSAILDLQLAVSADEARHHQAISDDALRKTNWRWAIVVNAVGAVATFIVLCVFIATKFIHGAWLVVVIIPILVVLFRSIHKHYVRVTDELRIETPSELRLIKHEVIVPVSGIHKGVIRALEYAKSIAPDHVTAIYVEVDEKSAQNLKVEWEKWNFDVPLVILPSPYRSLTKPLLRYVHRVERQHGDDLVTVLLPEFVPARWWHQILHNQNSLILKGLLLFKRGIIVTSVPYHLEK
jgi:hypothetical protein